MAQTNPSQRDAALKPWLQVARADTKGKIIDFTDPDPEPVLFDPKTDEHAPKFAINYCAYAAEGSDFKASVQHRHWIDIDTLDLLAWDLLTTRKGEKGEKGYTPILDEFKGGSAAAAKITELGANGIVSRRFTVTYNDGLNIGPVYQFSFIVCEGRKGDKGQIMPVKDGKVFVKEQINVSVQTARKLGLTLHRYLQAKLAAAILRHDYSPPIET
jgi:hypothetical protein